MEKELLNVNHCEEICKTHKRANDGQFIVLF